MKKLLTIILLLLFLILAVGTGVFFYFSDKTKFNDSYVNGNSAGNLYNGGFFCEKDGIVYFANPSDEYALYSMGPGGSNLKKLSDDSVSYINVDDHYIYYVRNNPGSSGDFSFLSINTNSLCRIDLDGDINSLLILDSEPCLYASLIGNYVYYIHYSKESGASLYKVMIDGSDKQQVDTQPYYTSSALGQYLYYNGLKNEHYIWRLNTADDSRGMLYGGNCWMPTVTDVSTAYFMDCDNNYALAHVDLSTGEKTILSEDRVDCYNVHGGYIYFQRNDPENPALCRMRTDGSDYEIISTGNHMNLNITSEYLYFREYESEQMYRVSTAIGGEAEAFSPGVLTK
ncbi:MAG: DUF5050 domain-containing protein [Roseburia sp.]